MTLFWQTIEMKTRLPEKNVARIQSAADPGAYWKMWKSKLDELEDRSEVGEKEWELLTELIKVTTKYKKFQDVIDSLGDEDDFKFELERDYFITTADLLICHCDDLIVSQMFELIERIAKARKETEDDITVYCNQKDGIRPEYV